MKITYEMLKAIIIENGKILLENCRYNYYTRTFNAEFIIKFNDKKYKTEMLEFVYHERQMNFIFSNIYIKCIEL